MNQQVLESLQGSTQVMQAVNAEMNPQQMMQTMKTFAMEMEKAGIVTDQVMDTFEMLEDPSMQAGADDVYNGVLGELELEYREGQPAIPTKRLNQPEEIKVDEENLEARVAALQMAAQ